MCSNSGTLLLSHTVSVSTVCCAVLLLQKDLFVDRTGEYWGKFGAVQGDIQQAYSGNDAALVDQASSGMLG